MNRALDPEDWKPKFLQAMRLEGVFSAAIAAADVSARTARYHRVHDPEFRAAWDEAKELAIDDFEREARRRALNGSDTLLIFLLKANRPIYRDRITVDLNLLRTMAEQMGLDEEDVIGEAQTLLLEAARGGPE